MTYLGVLIGLLISGGIFGLWSAVRHIHAEEEREQVEKDSVRTVYREHLAAEVAKEQAIQDSIDTYQNTHSSAVIASRMQVILSDELKHANQRPYYDKYRTEDFKSDLQEVITFDKTPREEKPGMTFRDIPFYQWIPAKMIRDLMIKRIYYVTNERARVDVRYLVKRVEKIKEEDDKERDTTYYEQKTATYRLAYQDGEWMVDDRMVDFLSEREAFKRYMEGEYFIDPVEEELSDSLAADSLMRLLDSPDGADQERPVAKKKDEPKKSDNKKNDVKKSDTKKKDESKNNDKKKTDVKKNDVKKNDVKKNDVKKNDVKKNDVKKNDSKKSDTKKNDVKKNDVKKNDTKKKEEPKKKSDTKTSPTTKK